MAMSGNGKVIIMLAKVFHSIVVCYYLCVWLGLRNVVTLCEVEEKFLHVTALSTRYLTNWNLFLQTMFFLACLLYDFRDNIAFFKRRKDEIKKLMDFWFFTICLPISVFVAIAFWTMYTYDKSLIFPRSFEKVMSPWVNHAIHTNIVILVFLEMIFVYRRLPSLLTSFIVLTGFMAAYGGCIYGTYFEKNVWVYPIYNRLSEFQQLLLTLSFYAGSVACFFFTRLTKYCLDGVKQDQRSTQRTKKAY